MRGSLVLAATSLQAIVAWSGPTAAAEDQEISQGEAAAVSTRTGDTASRGAFLPFSQAASVDQQRAYAVGFAGYDSARRTGSFEAATEVRLWGPIAVRGAAVYTNGDRTMRPSFGARVQALREGRQAVDGSFGVFYRPEGLTEPEGEIESVLSVGRHAGRTYLLGNLLYGQDPEGSERDGELRLAALRPVGARFLAGFDGRFRFDLGSDPAKLAQHHEPTLDANLGPCATALLGPLALSVQSGASALRLQQTTAFGAFVVMGIGATL